MHRKVSRLLLNGSFAPSVKNFRGPMIASLVERGYAVHVSVPDVSDEQRTEIEALGAMCHEIPLSRAGLSPLADWRYFTALRRLIRQVQPGLVIGYTIKPNIWGSLAARAEGVASASMITGLGYAFSSRETARERLISDLCRKLYRRAAKANNVVIFQNPDDLADFVAARCLPGADKARLVDGSGVDLAHFAPAPLPEAPVFVMVARLLVSKGVREYAEAARSILAERTDCRFLLAGNLDQTPDRIDPAELAEWQASGIEYLGWCADVRDALRRSSVFVLPSWREGTPRSALEAMAMRRPIITTDAPGCRETVSHGVNGLLVPMRDPQSLADAMRRLADSPMQRETMAAASLCYAQEKYEVGRVNRSLFAHLGL